MKYVYQKGSQCWRYLQSNPIDKIECHLWCGGWQGDSHVARASNHATDLGEEIVRHTAIVIVKSYIDRRVYRTLVDVKAYLCNIASRRSTDRLEICQGSKQVACCCEVGIGCVVHPSVTSECSSCACGCG